jgi:hypothetical protein
MDPDPVVVDEAAAEREEHGHKRGAKASLRSLAALVVACTGAIGAIAALVRPADQSVTKASYETLSEGIADVDKRCSEQVTRIEYECREENVALRSYVAGFTHAPMAGEISTTTAVAPSRPKHPAPWASASVPPIPMAIPTGDRPAADAAMGTVFVPTPAPAPPAAATGWKAPQFDAVQKRAKAE